MKKCAHGCAHGGFEVRVRPPEKVTYVVDFIWWAHQEADLKFLRVTIKQQTEQTEYAAQKEEAAGHQRAGQNSAINYS
jgi:hypothetical protein